MDSEIQQMHQQKITTVMLALLIHPKQPVRTGLGAILRERHGTAIASSDDDTAAAV
jgi:hypothetical protein